ncbi:MAG: hypothetical protein J6M24_03280 [Lachnospiraceae bacterium]|nr:hypothetical protein [Lachnospiraceae bacterium]
MKKKKAKIEDMSGYFEGLKEESKGSGTDGIEAEFFEEIEEEDEPAASKPGRKKEKKKKKEGKVEKIEYELPFIYRFLIKLAILGVICLVCFVFLNKKCKVKKFEIIGNSWYQDEEIINLVKTSKYDKYSIFMKAHYVLKEPPIREFIEEIKIEMVSLDTMRIKVYEKSIVGCFKTMADYMYFDKDGIIVASRVERQNNIPLVEGLDFSWATVGKKLDIGNDSVYKTILDITQAISKNKVATEKISFDKDLNVSIYCSDRNIVFCGIRERYDDIVNNLPEILEAAEKDGRKFRMDMSKYSDGNRDILSEVIEERADAPAAEPETTPGDTKEE